MSSGLSHLHDTALEMEKIRVKMHYLVREVELPFWGCGDNCHS